MMPVRHPFSAFASENTPILRENQYNSIRFDSLNPPFQYSRTHHSNCGAKFSLVLAGILIFQELNWDYGRTELPQENPTCLS
jgi:hypothetical protein